MNKQERKEASKKMWAKAEADIKDCLNDLKHKKTRKRQIPNLLTASRIFAPLFVVPTALAGHFWTAMGFVTGFALTDFFDGKLARKYGTTSEFGAQLDAFSDKIFGAGLMLPLIFFHPIMVINLGLEGVISRINYKSRMEGNKPITNMIGKFKTWPLFALPALGYLGLNYSIPNWIVPAVATVTAGLQIATAGIYYKSYKKAEEEKKTVNTTNVHPEVQQDEPKEKELQLEKKTSFPNEEEIKFLKNYRDSVQVENQPQETLNNKTKDLGIHPSTKKSDK